MEEALQRLDDMSKNKFSKFGAYPDTFVIDGSALSGDMLVERVVLTKIIPIRDYFQYQVLVRIATNTMRCIKKHSNKIGDIIRIWYYNGIGARRGATTDEIKDQYPQYPEDTAI